MYFAVSPLFAPAWGEGLGRWRGFPQASTINNCQKSNRSTFHKSAGNRIKGRNAQLTGLRPVCRSYPFWVPRRELASIDRCNYPSCYKGAFACTHCYSRFEIRNFWLLDVDPAHFLDREKIRCIHHFLHLGVDNDHGGEHMVFTVCPQMVAPRFCSEAWRRTHDCW